MLAIVAAPAAEAGAATGASATRSGAVRQLPAHFFGFNAESIVLPADDKLFAHSRALHTAMASIPVGVLRIPGGTTSQWLDWHNGRFVEAPGSPFAAVSRSRPALRMADWASIVRATRATPLWDLNVLTSNLRDQLAMLRRASRLGLPVRYIELGNELWNPLPPYPTRFPTGAAYGRAMNPWISALKRSFPDAIVAVSGADETASSPLTPLGGARYATWNASLLSAVRGEDAIAIHPYWNLPGSAVPGSDASATLLAGEEHWADFARETVAALPAHVKVWLTEWNETSLLTTGGTQIWAQALSVSAVALAQLVDRHITLSLLHDLVGGAANPQDFGTAKVFPLFTDGVGGSHILARTALGYAVPLVYSTLARARSVQRLRVLGAPQVGGRPGVTGVVVFGHRLSALFVNLTGRSIRLRLPRSLSRPAVATSLHAPESSQPGWAPRDRVARSKRTVYGSVVLPPYSLTRIAVR
jgi:hypothetical protein